MILSSWLLTPPTTQLTSESLKEAQLNASIQFALILKCIWNLQNQVVFKSSPPNLHAVCRGLELKDFEHYNSVKGPSFSIEPTTARWKPPLTNFIKLNVDATWKKQHSSIAVIAKDSKGDILGAWAKE